MIIKTNNTIAQNIGVHQNSNENSLAKNTIIYSIGNFGSKILSFLLVPIYSFYLNKGQLGRYDLIITTINLIIPFLTLQVSESVFRWLITAKGDSQLIKKTVSNATGLVLINIVIVIALSFILFLIYPINEQIYITLLLITSTIYPVLQQTARGFGKSKMYAINGLLFTCIYLAGNLIMLLLFKIAVLGLIVSSIIAYSLCSIILVYKLRFWTLLNLGLLSRENIKELLKYSLPLVPNSISWWMISSANKYIILVFLGVAANGLFAMSSRLSAILVAFNQIFILAWQESAILSFDKTNRDEQYSNILDRLIRVKLGFTAVLILSSQWLVLKIISPAYFASWIYMPIGYISVAFLSFSGFYGTIYLGAKKTKDIFVTTIAGGVINIVLCLLLVKWLGLIGVAIATAVGYSALLLIRVYSVKKISDIKFPLKTFIKYMFIVMIALYITYTYSANISMYIMILMAILILLDNKTILQELFLKLKKRNRGSETIA